MIFNAVSIIPEECIMIGDSLERDINGAINAGLRAVYYNPNEIPPGKSPA